MAKKVILPLLLFLFILAVGWYFTHDDENRIDIGIANNSSSKSNNTIQKKVYSKLKVPKPERIFKVSIKSIFRDINGLSKFKSFIKDGFNLSNDEIYFSWSSNNEVNFKECSKTKIPEFDLGIIDPLVAACYAKPNPNLVFIYKDACELSIGAFVSTTSDITKVEEIKNSKLATANFPYMKMYLKKIGLENPKFLYDISSIQTISKEIIESKKIDVNTVIISPIYNYENDTYVETFNSSLKSIESNNNFKKIDELKLVLPCTVFIAKKTVIERMEPTFVNTFITKINDEVNSHIWVSLFKTPTKYNSDSNMREYLINEELDSLEKNNLEFEKIEQIE